MAGYKGHTIGGLIAFLFFGLTLIFFISFLNPLEIPILFILCLLGALWPDVDTASKGRILFYLIFIILDVILILLRYYEHAALLGLFAMLPAISKHRGWTHSLWAAFVVPLPLIFFSFLGDEILFSMRDYEYRNHIFIGLPYYLAFTTGILSHLIIDRKGYGLSIRRKADRRLK